MKARLIVLVASLSSLLLLAQGAAKFHPKSASIFGGGSWTDGH